MRKALTVATTAGLLYSNDENALELPENQLGSLGFDKLLRTLVRPARQHLAHPFHSDLPLGSGDAVPTAFHRSAVYAALVGERQVTFCDRFTQRGVHQLMDVKAHGLSRIGRYIKDSCVHPNRVLGTYLDTVSTIDTDPQVDVKADRVLLDVRVRVLTGHDGDALGRANRLAQHAAHAAGGVVLTHSEAMAAAETRHERPEFLGILDGRSGGKKLVTAQEMGSVEKEVAEEMAKGDFESAEDLGDVKVFPEGQLAPADNFYSHDRPSLKRTNTTAVTTTLATAMGNSPFQPSFISWS